MPAGPARGAETPGHARARPASRLSAEPRAAAPEGGDGTPSRWQEADGEKLAPSPRGDRTFVWVGDRPGEPRFNCEPPPRLFQKLAGHTSRNKQMTKKHLIIVMRSAREGLSEPRLIKAVCQGAVRPSRGCRPPARPGPAVSRGTRRVINAGDIDGGEGLPRPRRQLDGSALPKRGGRAMHQPPANAGPRLLLTRCGPGFSTTGDDAVTHQASTRAVPWPLEPDPHGHRGDPFPGTPSLLPSSGEVWVEAVGSRGQVSTFLQDVSPGSGGGDEGARHQGTGKPRVPELGPCRRGVLATPTLASPCPPDSPPARPLSGSAGYISSL